MRQFLKLIFFTGFVFGNSLALVGQNYYSGYTLKAGSSLPTPPPFTVSQSNGTTIFEAEYEIVLGPDCITYPTCTGSDNYFYTTGFYDVSSQDYFLAKLGPPPAYAELKKQLDGSFYETKNKKLYFKYVEKYVEGTLDYQVYDYLRNPKVSTPITNPALILDKKVGDNYLILDLSQIPSITFTTEAASYYTLEVTNEKKEVTVLRFRYSPDEQ